jgi:ribosomal protein S19
MQEVKILLDKKFKKSIQIKTYTKLAKMVAQDVEYKLEVDPSGNRFAVFTFTTEALGQKFADFITKINESDYENKNKITEEILRGMFVKITDKDGNPLPVYDIHGKIQPDYWGSPHEFTLSQEMPVCTDSMDKLQNSNVDENYIETQVKDV